MDGADWPYSRMLNQLAGADKQDDALQLRGGRYLSAYRRFVSLD